MAKNEIVYRGKTYTKIRSGNCYLSTALLSDSLEVNTLNFTLESGDTSLVKFKRYDPVIYRHGGKQVGHFYADSIKRIAKNQYEFKAVSALGLMIDGKHLGGIYTGQEAQTLIDDICGAIAHVVKNDLRKIKIYGWLPIDSPRNNLARVLFAIGATVKTDLDGVLHIEGLWDGISGVQDQICIDAKVDYTSEYSSVSVIEHQYINDATATEEVVFEGAAGDESVIYLQKPYHSYRGEGIAIKKSDANYATITGDGKLYAKPYRHSERLVSMEIDNTIEPKNKEITDATLVTLVNSAAVVSRMAAFYQCNQIIEAPAYYTGEKPGDRVTVEHPYDAGFVDATVQSMDITISNSLKSAERLLVHYIPPQVGEVEYLDQEIILTGTGTWTVPDGATQIRVVLIGAGGPGENGENGGGSATDPSSINSTVRSSNVQFSYTTANHEISASSSVSSGDAGNGGKGGAAGIPGKILEVIKTVQVGEQIHYSCGLASAFGSDDAETTFGGHSSSGGTISQLGFTDILTGKVYGRPGEDGETGGNGGTGGNNGEDTHGAIGGNAGAGGETTRRAYYNKTSSNDPKGGTLVGTFSIGNGGGGGAGGGSGKNNGTNGEAAVLTREPYVSLADYNNGNGVGAAIRGGAGGNGANGADAETYGSSGGGGGGGGGAGACSSNHVSIELTSSYACAQGETYNTMIRTSALAATAVATGGTGGDGGAGADGCVIIFYKTPKEIKSGAVRDKNGKFMLDKSKRQMIV